MHGQNHIKFEHWDIYSRF